ncbi:uncharacterized protein LOC122499757 [Leptopilina heterotoma]|uniref:uncharacterized protein LOC122499757 n=1 Tax=Leptopilina heterotoma TaxID=63436 RepID=UPI001CA8932F|nr:uncharacterized protein LOC122499757 [Leptopilina heterotoma]
MLLCIWIGVYESGLLTIASGGSGVLKQNKFNSVHAEELVNETHCISVYILNIIVPLNESRPRDLPFPVYYFVDYSEDHFYWVVLYVAFNSFWIITIYITFESVLATSIEHACGLFKLISFHLRMINVNEMEMENLKAVRFCIEQHNRAIEFVVTNLDDFEIALKFGIFLIASSTNLLVHNVFSQRLMDHSTEIADTM